MANNPRTVALDVLNQIFEEKAYANLALDKALSGTDLKKSDRNLVSALVYGVTAKERFLSWYLAPFIKKQPKPWLQRLLQLTIYQICFMDRIPTSAAVDEAVKIAKREESQSTGNFVNAVLRNFMRSTRRNEEPKDWETKYSIPKFLIDKFVAQFGGKRTEEILESLEVPSHASIRVNTTLTSVDDMLSALTETRLSELSPTALISKQGNFAETAAFKEGKITIQDETSQLVAPLLELTGTEKVLDACSAPGGKATHIAQYLTTGHIIACDLYDHKLRLIEQNAQRLHLNDKISPLKVDATALSKKFPAETFDRVLVDAPCSGIGLLRRKPDIKYHKEITDFVTLSQLQLAILSSASQTLRKNGIMIYSTCTIFDEENFDVVTSFLATHPNFEQVPIRNALTTEKPELSKNGCIFITPELFHTDGFFIAKFRKMDSSFQN